MFFSIIVPLYNRPQEIDELLHSLTKQQYKNFEVLIIEDGSFWDAKNIVERYHSQLNVSYYFKKNEGQGFARNFGFERAKGDYFIVFDSDCLIPENYLTVVYNRLIDDYLDAYGGPDAAHPSFTSIQKAISYAMTSLFTTGGIRGNKKHIGQFHPRSFNMGISKEVWEKTRGYAITRMGEDIEFSIRIHKQGFKIGLIPEAYVYHKRRTNFKQFFKQLHFFGRARINIYRFFPAELKFVHFFPALFVLFSIITLLSNLSKTPFANYLNFLLGIYVLVLFADALIKTRSLMVAVLSTIAAFVQLIAYGLGFIQELITLQYKKSR